MVENTQRSLYDCIYFDTQKIVFCVELLGTICLCSISTALFIMDRISLLVTCILYGLIIGYNLLCWLLIYKRKAKYEKYLYWYRDGEIFNKTPDREICVCIYDNCYIAECTMTVSIGKTIREYQYYMLSYTLFDYSYIGMIGLNMAMQMFEENIVLLPKNKETLQWLSTFINVFDIPQYPSSLYTKRGR